MLDNCRGPSSGAWLSSRAKLCGAASLARQPLTCTRARNTHGLDIIRIAPLFSSPLVERWPQSWRLLAPSTQMGAPCAHGGLPGRRCSICVHCWADGQRPVAGTRFHPVGFVCLVCLEQRWPERRRRFALACLGLFGPRGSFEHTLSP